MAWPNNPRPAKSLVTLRDQVNAAYPGRRTDSDGMLASEEHTQQNPTSAHEPNSAGVVRALDLTHDPAHGFDSYRFADILRSKNDPRFAGGGYIISNRRIWNPSISQAWRPYNGRNPHSEHVHIEPNKNVAALYDDPKPWDIGERMPDQPEYEPILYPPLLKRGSTGDAVKVLQFIMGVLADGDFGPKTETAVRAFQTKAGIGVDGRVGPETWRAIEQAFAGPAEQPEEPEPIPPPEIVFRVQGKMSTFGGPLDTGVKPDEGLALYESAAQLEAHGIHVLSVEEAHATGLARRLDPTGFYLACRWDYEQTPKAFLQDAIAKVSANGKTVDLHPVDWGPNITTGRVADLSPGGANYLGLKTDDQCSVTIYKKGD